MFTAYIEKVFRCTRNILVKSEYIEFEYEYMTYKLYEYKYEYFKMYWSTRVPSTSAQGLVQSLRLLGYSGLTNRRRCRAYVVKSVTQTNLYNRPT